MEKIVIVAYIIPLIFIFIYSLLQLDLVMIYRRKSQTSVPISAIISLSSLPKVTIQLPIFNEKYVVERLINTVCAIEYPQHLLEIQVLDDSTDETLAIAQAIVLQQQQLGFNIKHLQRPTRVGFKAGALAWGLQQAQGEFVAIFDADFLPEKHFLQETIPYFQNPLVGLVQSRWTHLNRDYSLITELQAFGLDAHFNIEQTARNKGYHFINFNGTGGIWRKETIIQAGGWSADTLTEDLDLSYRAQLQGWQFVYLANLSSPAELPVEMNALKAQQRRWTKGAAECCRKHLKKVWQNNRISWKTKLHASFHLMNSATFIALLALSLLSGIIQDIARSSTYSTLFVLANIFHICLFILALFYWVSYQKQGIKMDFFIKFPLFLSFMMGLSLHNSLAVLEGYWGKKTPFVRTPKLGIKNRTESWTKKTYSSTSLNILTWIEISLTLFFARACYHDILLGDTLMLLFHSMLTWGFGAVSGYSIWHWTIGKVY